MQRTVASEVSPQTGVVYGHFYIQDKGVSWFHDSSQPEPGPPEDDDLVRTALDWISIVSAAGDHVAGAQLEAWDWEPQRQDDWEVSADFEFTCTTGNVALVAVMMGPSTEELIIGAPGTYRGRVYSRGAGGCRGGPYLPRWCEATSNTHLATCSPLRFGLRQG
ncbi:hypothetical protein [Parafrankia soli]|uniref:hypothetical protein n=1 Tax=Parafrankia soli TaxID=2599596 RepID=UPI001F5254EC|nr:hypothetical protein [Parafrankia soli]